MGVKSYCYKSVYNSVVDSFTFNDIEFIDYQWQVYKIYDNKPSTAILPGPLNAVGAKPTSGFRSLNGTDQQLFDIPQSPTQTTSSLQIASTTDIRYHAGATNTLFRNLTASNFSSYTGGFTINFATGSVNYTAAYVADYSIRGNLIFDAQPRLISNLISNQTGKSSFETLDNPYAREWTQSGTRTGLGRVSQNNNTRHETILTGSNPLPNSDFFAIFGQYHDHGLDFLDKGNDGTVLIPLLPGDQLYKAGSTTNFMALSRGNTVRVRLGEGSKDSLLTELGLDQYALTQTWDVDNENAAVGRVGFTTIANGGNVVLNDQIITIPTGSTLNQVVDAFNKQSPFTGVIASIGSNAVLKLSPRNGKSFNFTSAFVDLNQTYGSTFSHGIFLREYKANGDLTGAMLTGSNNGIARWTDLKNNALQIGLVIHDIDVSSVPLVEVIPVGKPGAGRLGFVTLNKISGEKGYIFDTALLTADSVLVKSGSAFMIDLANNWRGATRPAGESQFNANGDLKDASVLNLHTVGGDGRANENLGLTSLHQIFANAHNAILEQLEVNISEYQKLNRGFTMSGEEKLEAAKLVTEQFYQHHVFQEYARRITPDLGAFAGVSAGFNPSILAEFASSTFRFGHSQLSETLAMANINPETGIALTEGKKDIPLLQAFLAPQLYTDKSAAEIVAGTSNQVGNLTDEYVTNTLRNALVGLPLDLAALNIGRGQDSGISSLNQARREMQAFLRNIRLTPGTTATNQTNNGIDARLAAQEANLRPYVSWRDFGNHLLHSNSLKGFIMAYSRDAILSSYSNNTSLNYWNNLQASNNAADASTYVAALSSAADAAILDNNFMGNAWTGTSVNALDPNYQGTSGNQDFQKISLWIGGLAEARVPGGMLGPTHNFIYSYQMQQLERGDENYYLSKLGGTDLLASIQGKVLADLVMESTGVRHLYHKIFAVNDADYELDSESNLEFNSNAALSAATKTVTDIFGVSQTVGLAGYVNDVFIGNGGNYLDARGELNPNGIGNASEMFGGTDDADTIKGLGGDDCIWGDGGNDVAYGGTGNDFIDGGTGNDNIFGEAGNDLLRGGDGNDDMFGGSENDDMYGGEGNDFIDGGTGSDDINGQAGNDQLFGGDDVDTLKGGEGNDKLYGEAGSDVLTGGMGNDSFYFDQPLAITGIDRITDFSPNLDKLVLSSVIYSQLSINGIGVNQFESIAGSSTANVIAEATRSSTRIVYNSNNGSLSYDIDGAGTSPGVQIATLSKFNAYFPSDVISAQALFPILTASDFIIIG